MRDIEVEFVDRMRYTTAGDYFIRRCKDVIQVKNQINDDYNFLIAIHELVEKHLTERLGIKEEDILAWDLANPDLDEPGAHKMAPYHKQHQQAEKIERMLAKFMNINWDIYENEIIIHEQS